MASQEPVSRRDFLRTSAQGAGALLLGFYLPVLKRIPSQT
jgi:hypothetical protein